MSTRRFMAYIAGGTVPGTDRHYDGCRDKTEPSEKLVLTSSDLQGYFVRNSSVWGEAPYNVDGSRIFGGLSVIGKRENSPSSNLKILEPGKDSLEEIAKNGDMILAGYSITFQQFNDVMVQENRLKDDHFEMPESVLELLSADNSLLNLKNRTGENALVMPDGTRVEINVPGAYGALLYLGEVEVNGEMVKAVTFTTPLDYERAAAQTYLNSIVAKIPNGFQDSALDAGASAIDKTIGKRDTDKLHRLNPGTIAYANMIVEGILEISEGKGDWTKENALDYVLAQPPFCDNQLPGLATMIRESFGIDGTSSTIAHFAL